MAREVEETAVPTNDAYTGMLVISLLALVAGCLFLYLDWSQYPDKPPPKPNIPKVAAPQGAAPVPTPNAAPQGQPPNAAPPMPMGNMPPMAVPNAPPPNANPAPAPEKENK